MTPLERAAREAQIVHNGWAPGTASDSWREWLPAVRAVLAAIREPSEAMIDEVHSRDLDIYWSYNADGSPGSADDVWRIMIDAALAEEG